MVGDAESAENASRRAPGLDGIRGLAVAAITLYHLRSRSTAASSVSAWLSKAIVASGPGTQGAAPTLSRASADNTTKLADDRTCANRVDPLVTGWRPPGTGQPHPDSAIPVEWTVYGRKPRAHRTGAARVCPPRRTGSTRSRRRTVVRRRSLLHSRRGA